MPKLKTHSGMAKRAKATKSGKFKIQRAGRRHMLESTTPKQSRKMRSATYVHPSNVKAVKQMLPYA